VNALAQITAVLLRGSLALFPASYRREYGDERTCVLQLALTEAAAAGNLHLLRFFAREGRDLPLALWQEHSKEWRRFMNGVQQSPTNEGVLPGRQLLLFVMPFLAVLSVPLARLIQGSFWEIPILGLMVMALVLAVAGLIKNLPHWALPSLGLAIGIVDMLFFSSLIYAIPVVGTLKGYLWTDFMPGRVLYALIISILGMVPPTLLLVVLALLSARLPPWSAFRQRLGQDWTLLPFVLYVSNLITPFYEDPYRGLEPYQLLFTLVLAGGAWAYLRASRQRVRLAALMVATLLSGLVLALGIYQIYPAQSWVKDAITGFPRWWEGLIPLLNTLALLGALCLIAAFGSLLSQRELPTAPGL
jgi:hypothetical protein